MGALPFWQEDDSADELANRKADTTSGPPHESTHVSAPAETDVSEAAQKAVPTLASMVVDKSYNPIVVDSLRKAEGLLQTAAEELRGVKEAERSLGKRLHPSEAKCEALLRSFLNTASREIAVPVGHPATIVNRLSGCVKESMKQIKEDLPRLPQDRRLTDALHVVTHVLEKALNHFQLIQKSLSEREVWKKVDERLPKAQMNRP